MSCKHKIMAMDSCVPIEANLVRIDQDCESCPYKDKTDVFEDSNKQELDDICDDLLADIED